MDGMIASKGTLAGMLTLAVLALIGVQASAQGTDRPAQIGPCNIQEHYGDFLAMDRSVHDGKEYFALRVFEAPKEACFAELVNGDQRYVDYLAQNFAKGIDRTRLARIADDGEMNAAFIQQLQADTAFNEVMIGWVGRAVDRTQPKDTVTMAEMLNVAVKFFSIYKLNAEGRYVGKICVGLNDVAKTEELRMPCVEAFCFSTIFGHLGEGEFNLYDEFIKSAKQLYDVNLGVDPQERLLRAQGAMYFLMRDSAPLKAALAGEYGRRQHSLPFILADP